MKKHPYISNVYDPEDYLEVYVDNDYDEKCPKETMRLLCKMPEPMETHDVTCSIFYEKNFANGHMAKLGCESMIIVDDGDIEVKVRDKYTHVTKGDVMHFGIYNPHQMHWMKDTTWVGFFSNMDICSPARDKDWVGEHNPDLPYDAMRQVFRDSYDCYGIPDPVATEVPKSEIYEIRGKDESFYTAKFPGVTADLKIGRWETQGKYEYWRLTMKKGFHVEYDKINPRGNVFFVAEGEVRFKLYDDEFVAPAGSVVQVPDYSKYSFCAESDAVMYDMYNSCLFFNLISDLKSYETYEPEKLKDPAFLEELKAKYDCFVTSWGEK